MLRLSDRCDSLLCRSIGALLAAGLLLLIRSHAAHAAPVAGSLDMQITVVPQGNLIVPTVVWSTTPPANRCVATGSWTGSKPVSGSRTFAAVAPPRTYTLTCAWDDTDVRLSWSAPTQNADGSPLTNLAGYRIFYGNDPANLSQTVEISDPAATSRDISGLAAGVWHFAMTAKNAAGVESQRSSTVSATLGSADTSKSVSASVGAPLPPAGLTATP